MANGRVQKSTRNIAYMLGYQIITIVLQLICRRVFIHTLGDTYVGIGNIFSNILDLLSLASLGIETSMVFSFYQPLAEHDEQKLAQLTAYYKRIYRWIAAAMMLIGIGFLPFLRAPLINVDTPIPHLKLYYLLYMADTIAPYLTAYRVQLLTADQKQYIISRYTAIFETIRTIIQILLLCVTRNFAVYIVMQAACTYAENLYGAYLSRKQYPATVRQAAPLPEAERKKLTSNIKSGFIYKLSSKLVTSTDNILISMMADTVTSGFYGNYSTITDKVVYLINIFFSQITASIGNLMIEKDREKNYRVFETLQLASFLLVSVCDSCVFVLINDFVRLWLGPERVFAPIVVTAIVINMYFSSVLAPLWSYRDATGIYRQTKYVQLATAIVNIGMSILLGAVMGRAGRQYAVAGIIFATSIARLTTYFWYEPRLLYREYFDCSVRKYYFDIGLNILLTVGVCALLTLLLGGWTPDSWPGMIAKILIVFLCATAMTLLFYCRSPYFKEILGIAKRILRKGKKS